MRRLRRSVHRGREIPCLAAPASICTLNPVGSWSFETAVNIFASAGHGAGLAASFVAAGELDPQAGVTEGSYTGTICI